MQVGSELLQGFLRPRGGQVEADKLQGGVPLQQHLTLMSSRHCWQGSFLRSAKSSCRVVVVSVTGVLGSCREGDDTTPAGRGEAAEGWSARAMGPETGDGGTDSQKATLAGKTIMGIKKSHLAHGPQQRLYRRFRVRPGVARQGSGPRRGH